MLRRLSEVGVRGLAKRIGAAGIAFFSLCKIEHGRVDACWMDEGIPHPIHFREGMYVRNAMRSLPQCSGWDAHDFDDSWVQAIEDVLKFNEAREGE